MGVHSHELLQDPVRSPPLLIHPRRNALLGCVDIGLRGLHGFLPSNLRQQVEKVVEKSDVAGFKFEAT